MAVLACKSLYSSFKELLDDSFYGNLNDILDLIRIYRSRWRHFRGTPCALQQSLGIHCMVSSYVKSNFNNTHFDNLESIFSYLVAPVSHPTICVQECAFVYEECLLTMLMIATRQSNYDVNCMSNVVFFLNLVNPSASLKKEYLA